MGFLWDAIQWLEALDKELMLFLNRFHSPLFDGIMWVVSDKWVWIPFYIILAFFIFRRAKWAKGLVCLLFIFVTITLSDQICGSAIRHAVCRLRPSNPDNPISPFIHLVNDYHGGSYGFPSCHAANTFALATFLILYFRTRLAAFVLLPWTVLVGYSRIYLGVHYPGDILCGMCLGGLFGLSFYWLHAQVYVWAAKFALWRKERRAASPYRAYRTGASFVRRFPRVEDSVG